MDNANQDDVTLLLIAVRDGQKDALERFFDIVYDDLQRVARRRLGADRVGQTLNTVALVHETYIKLVDRAKALPEDRHHFFAIAAKAMRQIVVDNARRTHAAKRGGKERPVSSEDALTLIDASSLEINELATEILAIDQALDRLAAIDSRLAKVVELRFYGGLTVEEVATQLDVSDRTIKRDWRTARAFLLSELQKESP